MALTLHASGTQTAVVTTEHSLTTAATAGVYEFFVDPAAMLDGDVLELRIKARVLAAGTVRVVYLATYSGAQPVDDMIKVSVPFANDLVEAGAVDFTLKQTFGTGRNFPWKVIRHA